MADDDGYRRDRVPITDGVKTFYSIRAPTLSYRPFIGAAAAGDLVPWSWYETGKWEPRTRFTITSARAPITRNVARYQRRALDGPRGKSGCGRCPAVPRSGASASEVRSINNDVEFPTVLS